MLPHTLARRRTVTLPPSWVERTLERNGHRRLIGLTPIRPGVVALMLWSDGEIVQHLRDTEAEVCAVAHRWTTKVPDPVAASEHRARLS